MKDISEYAVNQRLKFLSAELNLTQTQFSESTLISEKTMSNIFRFQTLPTFKTLNSIAAKYSKLNTRWLLTGEGAMWQSDDLSQSEGKFPNNALVSASEPVTNFQVRQIVQPSQAPEIEIYYLKELLRQQEETITAYRKLVKELETPKE